MQEIKLDIYATLVCMVLVLLLGRYVISKVKFCAIMIFQSPLWAGFSRFCYHVSASVLQFWLAI
ncbi:hypothetical protein [Helicobacter pylori]|uniref:hypothetical protein n=1 Tax=Helicobacter pylori TaxID=210 RepID=UPI003CC50AC0